jgi:hypothetical protein
MKVQARYCSLAYFSAAFNTSGLAVALVTGTLVVVSVASINPVSVPLGCHEGYESSKICRTYVVFVSYMYLPTSHSILFS